MHTHTHIYSIHAQCCLIHTYIHTYMHTTQFDLLKENDVVLLMRTDINNTQVLSITPALVSALPEPVHPHSKYNPDCSCNHNHNQPASRHRNDPVLHAPVPGRWCRAGTKRSYISVRLQFMDQSNATGGLFSDLRGSYIIFDVMAGFFSFKPILEALQV
jgi:hypothetical protein